MRKLIVCNLISLDGYVAGDEGDVMVLPLDKSFNAYNLTRLRDADTLLLGANTYPGFVSYWPGVEQDPVQPDVLREISSINNRIAKVVVSDSLSQSDTGVWRETTEIVRRVDAHQKVADLKAEKGGEILMFGSVILWNDLLSAGLVDELHLMVGAGAIGSGEPAFLAPFGGHAYEGSLTLTGVRQLESSQNALLTYEVG